MNYWTELGWIIIPMDAIEIGFAVVACWIGVRLDKKRMKKSA